VLVVGLSVFGVAMVFSAGVLDVPYTVVAGLWRAQLLWLVLALLLMPVVMQVSPRMLQAGALPLYSLALVLLALTLVIGTGVGTSEGVPRWIVIGPLRIHTAEFAKIPVILMLASVLSDWREPPTSLFQLWKPIAVVAPPMVLVLGQPDLGTMIVFAFMLVGMLYWAGTPVRLIFFLVSPALSLILAFHTGLWSVWFLVLLGVLWYSRAKIQEFALVFVINVVTGTIALPFWNSLAQYQKNRILVFLDPAIDPRGAGYNLIQSRVAIGSGGLTGKGFTEGTQKRLAFLPEQHTDFIFSVIGEEWGFLGVAAIILAFGGDLLAAGAHRGYLANDPFASLVPFGLFASVVHPRAGEHGDDHRHHADHGHSAAVPELRRLVPADQPAGMAVVQRIAADYESRRM
jgi:rod shape determining protein RodA